MTEGRCDGRGGGGRGPLKRRAVDSVEGEIDQSLAGATGLVLPFARQHREVVAALNAPFHIETAQAMANQEKTQGHRIKA